MGDVADDILSSFSLGEDEKKNYDTVVKRFKRHFVKKRMLYLNAQNSTSSNKRRVSQSMIF